MNSLGIVILALTFVLLAARVERTQDSFPDVPKDHWAAQAVGELRALGLLKGYPDGRFRG